MDKVRMTDSRPPEPLSSEKAVHEIKHGKYLSEMDPEVIWGWGTPAGKVRAKRRGDLIAAAAKLGPGKEVLELGCGSGFFTRVFSDTGASVTAIDISPDLIEIAQKRSPKVKFICARYEVANFPQVYDAIIGSSVLHHLELKSALMKSLPLLRGGGIFAFAEPNLMNPQVLAERTLLWRFLHYVSPDETAFLRWRLESQLKKSGFVNVNIAPFDWLHPAIPARLIHAVTNIGLLLEKLPVLREFAGSLLIRCEKPRVV